MPWQFRHNSQSPLLLYFDSHLGTISDFPINSLKLWLILVRHGFALLRNAFPAIGRLFVIPVDSVNYGACAILEASDP